MNPLYLRINHANGYIGEINENKYFDAIDENKKLLVTRVTMMFLMEFWVKLKK